MAKPPCKFYQQGRCNKGNACNFSHILTNNSSTLNAKIQEIENDLADTNAFQLYPLCSSLGYGSVSVIPNRDYSFEELRLEFYEKRDSNRLDLHQQMLNARKQDMDRCIQVVKSDTQRAARYALESKDNSSLSPIINWEVNLTGNPPNTWGQNQNQHKGGGIFGNFSTTSNNNNVSANPFGASSTSSPFATQKTGAFGAFGAAANTPSSAFGAAPSTSSGFGSTGFNNSNSSNSFGGQEFGKSAFGSTPGGSGAFGAFAKAANTANPSNPSQTSAFNASATRNTGSSFGFSKFGSSGFGSTGSPAFGSTGFGSSNKSPFAAAAATTTQSSAFGNQSTFGSKPSPFASQNTQSQPKPFSSSSPFGGSTGNNNGFNSSPAVSTSSGFGATAQNPFGQSTSNTSAFGSAPQQSAFASSPAFGASQTQKTAFSAQGQQNPFGSSPFQSSNTQSVPTPSTKPIGPKHVYTDQSSLSQETLNLFKEEFRLGTVPDCPPPIELC